METERVLHVGYVLDMSGSMGGVTQITREAFNEYLKGLKEEAREGAGTFLSLTCFDTVFERWLVEQPVEEINYGLIERYQPRGGTALYDAIANTITEMDERMQKNVEDRVMIVVLTDGEENSSQEYPQYGMTSHARPEDQGAARLAELIKSYEDRGNWTFIYLSSGQADLGQAQAYAGQAGFSPGNVAAYSATADSVRHTTSGLSNVTRTRRSGITGQSAESFADAGEPQDYRDPAETYEKPEKTKSESINKLLGGDS